MSYRFMRILVFFDLPVISSDDRKEYRKFRKYLVKNGFVMLQESVYSKLAPNPVVGDAIVISLKRHKPPAGYVSVLKITEKQYSKMEMIVGSKKSDVLDSDERLIIL